MRFCTYGLSHVEGWSASRSIKAMPAGVAQAASSAHVLAVIFVFLLGFVGGG